MAVKKITYDGTVLIDLTNDTASAADVRTGKTFHANDGTIQTGTFAGGTDNMPAFMSRTYVFNAAPTINSFDYTMIGSGAFAWYSQSNAIMSFPSCITIGSGAFYRADFSQLTFPSCTMIGSYAFAYYPNTNIAFTALTSVPAYAFYQYSGTQLSNAMFPNAISIYSSAFRYASNLTTIDLPNVKAVYQYAFGQCINLTTVNLPEVNTALGQYAFYQDSKMTSISLPKATAATQATFYQCYSLPSIYLPNVSYISNITFAYCSYLTAAYFVSLNKISSTYAFRNCIRLISLYLLSTAMVTLTSRTTAFTSTPLSNYSTTAGQWGSIYVRQSLLATYLANTNWASFADRLVGLTDAQISALPIYS